MTVQNPVRVSTTDDPREILRFAAYESRRGGAALATLVEIRGGAARALGAHVAVAADGRFCGYVSGGCVETAVAAEATAAVAEGCDRTVMFGEGSPFFDIVLPCGGGITVAIHVIRQPIVIDAILEQLDRRKEASLLYDRQEEKLSVIDRPAGSTLCQNDVISMVYRPRTRVIVSGQTSEVTMVQRLAEACEYDVVLHRPETKLTDIERMIDRFTAVILLHHDLDIEAEILAMTLRSPAFYIGALGSTRTHRNRLVRLNQQGFSSQAADRIKAPIGLFGPTRDATSLSISALADVAAAWSDAYS